MATKASVGDDVLTAALIIGGGIAAYTIYRSFQVGEQTADYVGTKIDDTQNYITSGINRITGAPKYFWDETIGQGGLGLTGGSGYDNLVARVTNSGDTRTNNRSTGGGQSGSRRRRDNTEDANRTLLGKDSDSWGYGYGPKKGFISDRLPW
jgi:hypothetical protein